MNSRRWALVSLAVVASCVLVAAGCGGSGAGSSSGSKSSSATTGTTDTSGSAAASPQTVALRVTGGAFRFDKSALSAKAGKVTLKLTNSESIQHNIAIKGSDGKQLAAGDIVGDGGVSTITVDLKPGKYEYYCTPHEALGMKGTLTVS